MIENEGGYSDHPEDKGGETMYGITAQTAREAGYTGEMKLLTLELAKQIYRQQYWDRYKCDELPDLIARRFFDAAVNHGPGNASRMLQRALGVLDDGVVGPVTIRRANDTHIGKFLLAFTAERIEFYSQHSKFGTFGKGWMRRVANNCKADAYVQKAD